MSDAPGGAEGSSSQHADHAGIMAEGVRTFTRFMQSFTCYDLMPASSKIVVFDTLLPVRKAFYALKENGIRSAPLWDSKKQKLVGMVTTTDFANILRRCHASGEGLMDIENQNIQQWIDMSNWGFGQGLITVAPEATVYDAVKTLLKYDVHRLPVVDPVSGKVTAIMTHKSILQFLHTMFEQSEDRNLGLLKLPIDNLLGSYHNIASVFPETPLTNVLNVFASRSVSAVPIVNEHGAVIDVYAKSDILHLAQDGSYIDLNTPVHRALANRAKYVSEREFLYTCSKTDPVGKIMDRIVSAGVHRLVVVDKSARVDGIVSLADIAKLLTAGG